ncbi:MAG: DUF3536 domain-containing protein [Acidobacteria bacterium]|nr:MAG: DUF3536 domain-containing protein [Acidobacteriota bacterium]
MSGAGERWVCLHGHFYQPPRENPWLGAIEPQASARPYHDWNERVAAECYTPNAAARILNAAGELLATQNNYAHMSFDFGPTLLSWLQKAGPEAYAAVLAADRQTHCAMAQAYNHMILPLASARDCATQVLWGKRDFEHRFGREPDGMWLPEAAVNLASLEALAAAGIQFTVLAPRQARRVRRFGSHQWQDVSGSRIDPHFPYLVRLPSGRSVAVFFYDAGLAQAIAFEGLLRDGARLATRLAGAFDGRHREPQLVSAATDGESYGHHFRFGDMALAAALRFLRANPSVRLTSYAGFLAAHPPRREVEIYENSSWSCSHGVERWRADCGCNCGSHPGWRQGWRAPLRDALDWLRDELAAGYARAAGTFLWNPWGARNDYIDCRLDPGARVPFLERHARRSLSSAEQARVQNLLEMQTAAMFMFTSCGWFFDEVSGLEASQVLAYAARAVELARSAIPVELEPELLRRLETAPSNLPQWGHARAVYLAQLARSPAAAAASD